MAYRKFDTGTWQDPWFEDLSPNAKLAFIYLWTNEICTPSGLYEISEKRIKFDLGYGIDTIYSEIKTKVVWEKDRKFVWVKNFFRRQCQNAKFAISALNSLKDDPYKFGIFIQYNQQFIESLTDKNGKKSINLSAYHTDTISIPYPTETEQIQNRTDTVSETETDTDTAARENCTAECEPDFSLSDGFEKVWSIYPKKRSKGKAEKAFIILNPNEQLLETMISKIERAKTSVEWTREDGRYIPYLSTWFENMGWLDELTMEDTTKPNWVKSAEKGDL